MKEEDIKLHTVYFQAFTHPFNSISVGSFKMTVNVFIKFQKEEWAEAEKESFFEKSKIEFS